MTKVSDLTEIDAIVDADLFYVWDASTPSTPDKKVPASKMRPSGAKITQYIRKVDSLTIPTLAAGAEGAVSVTMTGAVQGDHAVFTPRALPPADIAITAVAITADDTVQVRFRNLSAGSIGTSALNYSMLVIKSVD